MQLDLFPTTAHLTRTEPDENVHRYYALAVTPDPFGGFALARSWGRIGRSYNVRIELYDTEAEAIDALTAWRVLKLRRGYA